ncbi:pyridoxal kinase, partial [Bacillus halotolerans]
LVKALQLTTASVYQVFTATFAAKSRELQLIQAQNQLVDPTIEFEIKRIR